MARENTGNTFITKPRSVCAVSEQQRKQRSNKPRLR
jgi:hypothetical protein